MDDGYRPDRTKDIVISTSECPDLIVITPEGKFYWDNRRVVKDEEIYQAFVAFLMSSGHYSSEEPEDSSELPTEENTDEI